MTENDDAGTGDVFHALQAELTVELISTKRPQLMTCAPHESLSDVMAENDAPYDFLPVVASGDGPQGRIIGLFHAERLFGKKPWKGRIEQHYAPLSEDHLIGADTSIRDFVVDADNKPCRLVISGPEIVGLVSLSDLQKLPVRAALFALITGLEISMSETIKRGCPSADDWKQHLTPGRHEKINDESEKSRQDDGFVDETLFTQFCDKADILRKGFCLPEGESKIGFRKKLKQIRDLRDALAHANEYAASPDQARRVCAAVRNLLTLRDAIVNMKRLGSDGVADGPRRHG